MHEIVIVGLGSERLDLTLRAQRILKSASTLILRTERCDCALWLREEGVLFKTLDACYDQAEDFDQLYRLLTEAVLTASEEDDVVYGVPDLRDASVSAILQAQPQGVRLIPGVPVDGALTARAEGAYTALAAADWEGYQPNADQGVLIRELDSRELASEVKLRLMERFPAETPICVLSSVGETSCELCDLDRLESYDHRTAAWIPAQTDLIALERYGFDQLNRIVRQLRAPGGCPWDIKQTHESLRINVVEEAYEVVDAIDRGDLDALYDELGDLLLQVALHAEIARQHGEFEVDDATTAICRKMIARHPHIFADAHAETSEDVLRLWEDVKRKEKQIDTRAQAMRAITRGMPALMRAEKVQKRAADVGFDWDGPQSALHKVYEEADEVKRALEGEGNVAEELGDLLFACVNVARLSKVQGELAISAASEKFVTRFEAMEQAILADGRHLEEMTLAQMDAYWERVKADE